MATKQYKTNKRYMCPYCDTKFLRTDLIEHVETKHPEMIPEGYTAARVIYEIVNKKNYGTCMICKDKVYEWDEKLCKYKNLCNKPSCREAVRKTSVNNMMRVYNKPHLLDDPMQQEKMLARRKISGTYKFSTDGTVVPYTGQYEKKLLEFFDKALNVDGRDIQSPGPVFEYDYGGKKHFWITDIYYIPANLVIEVKDGGDNPNNRPMKSYREKQVAKEEMITDKGTFNYLRLTNNNFLQLFEILADIKYDIVEPDRGVKISINENLIIDKDNVEHNLKEFKDSIINIALVVGFSGSGKTTLSKEIGEKTKSEVYELDDLLANYNFSDENLKEYGDLFFSFFNTVGKKYRISENDRYEKYTDDNYEKPLMNDFINYTESYAKSNKNKKFILEGIWPIYLKYSPERFKDWCVIIKGTSYITSDFRASVRNFKDDKGVLKPAKIAVDFIKSQNPERLKSTVSSMNKEIDRWRKYFNNIDTINENTPVGTGAMGGVPPARSNSVYIVPTMMNSVFDDENDENMGIYALFDDMAVLEHCNTLKSANLDDLLLPDQLIYEYSGSLNAPEFKNTILQALKSGENVKDNFILSTLLNRKVLDPDEIIFSNQFKRLPPIYTDDYVKNTMKISNEKPVLMDTEDIDDSYSVSHTPDGYFVHEKIADDDGITVCSSYYGVRPSNETINGYIIPKIKVVEKQIRFTKKQLGGEDNS